MYKNVGKKIKVLSIILAWTIVAIGSFLGFYRFFSNEISTESIVISIAIIAGSCIIAVVLSWFLYAFGVVTENSQINAENLENLNIIVETLSKELKAKRKSANNDIPLEDFKTPKTREELIATQLKKLKKDYEMSRITYDEYEQAKRKLEQTR